MKRSVAREKVFRIIFQREFHDDFEKIYGRLIEEEELRGVQGEYARSAVRGILDHIGQIDTHIKTHLKGWAFERLSKQVIAILRLGVYELVFCEDIPPITAIDEAVKLSYQYCDDKEAVFINGLLHALKQSIEQKETTS